MLPTLTVVTRQQWGALAPTASTRPFAAGWGGKLVVHYTGISARPDPMTFDERAEYLRTLQRTYQSGGRGDGFTYSDAPYSLAMWNDPTPEVWELRGLSVRTGANGTAEANAVWPSVLVVNDVGEDVHEEVRRKLAALVQRIRALSGQHTIVCGHRDVVPTGCPGPELYGWVLDGTLLPEHYASTPNPNPPAPVPPTVSEDDDMTLYVTNAQQRQIDPTLEPTTPTGTWAPGIVVYAIDRGRIRHVRQGEDVARKARGIPADPLSNDELTDLWSARRDGLA